MKKLITAATIILILGFAGGVYASENGWLNFTGDDQIAQSKTDVDEIMDILRQVNDDKLTAEEALAELEEMNPPGLVKQIKQLKDEITSLEEYIDHLESELKRANSKSEEMNTKTTEAVEEARNYLK